MTDDLVKRLHKWVDDLEHDRDYDLEFELSGEEAGNFANDICGMLTRIEMLEAALREITTKDLFGMNWAIRTARKALEPQSYRGQQDDSALKAERLTALSAEDIRKMNHE